MTGCCLGLNTLNEEVALHLTALCIDVMCHVPLCIASHSSTSASY